MVFQFSQHHLEVLIGNKHQTPFFAATFVMKLAATSGAQGFPYGSGAGQVGDNGRLGWRVGLSAHLGRGDVLSKTGQEGRHLVFLLFGKQERRFGHRRVLERSWRGLGEAVSFGGLLLIFRFLGRVRGAGWVAFRFILSLLFSSWIRSSSNKHERGWDRGCHVFKHRILSLRHRDVASFHWRAMTSSRETLGDWCTLLFFRLATTLVTDSYKRPLRPTLPCQKSYHGKVVSLHRPGRVFTSGTICVPRNRVMRLDTPRVRRQAFLPSPSLSRFDGQGEENHLQISLVGPRTPRASRGIMDSAHFSQDQFSKRWQAQWKYPH